MLIFRYLWLFSFLSIVQNSYGQYSKSDSLKMIVDSGTLEEKYNAYINLISIYEFDQQDSSLIFSLQLVETAKELNNAEKLGEAYQLLGINYDETGLYDKAIESYYRAIEYFDKSNLADKKKLIAGSYHNLGWTYTFLGELERAPRLFHNALDEYSFESRDDSLQHAISYHALGSYYSLYGSRLDSAIYYLKKAIGIRKKTTDRTEEIAQAELELVQAYVYANMLINAEALLNEVKSYKPDSLTGYSLTYITFDEGLILDSKSQYSLAFDKFKSVYSGLELLGLTNGEEAINLLKQMVATAENLGDPALAYTYLSLLRDTERNSIYKNRQRRTKALEITHETARKEGLIQEQESKLVNQQFVIDLFIIFTISSFVLLTIIGISAKKINSKNKRIELLMRELHHRVKNNLQIISSLLGLQSMKLADASAQVAITEGKERIRAMSLIHQKLYQNEEVTSLNIKEYITKLVDELTQSYGFADRAKVNIEVPSIAVDADTTLPIGLIVNELVSNAFKHAFKDINEPLLELKLIQEKKYFILHISDNGHGLPKGYNVESSTSFGLNLVNLLVKQLKGSLEVNKQNGLSYNINFQLL